MRNGFLKCILNIFIDIIWFKYSLICIFVWVHNGRNQCEKINSVIHVPGLNRCESSRSKLDAEVCMENAADFRSLLPFDELMTKKRSIM